MSGSKVASSARAYRVGMRASASSFSRRRAPAVAARQPLNAVHHHAFPACAVANLAVHRIDTLATELLSTRELAQSTCRSAARRHRSSRLRALRRFSGGLVPGGARQNLPRRWARLAARRPAAADCAYSIAMRIASTWRPCTAAASSRPWSFRRRGRLPTAGASSPGGSTTGRRLKIGAFLDGSNRRAASINPRLPS